jgi:ubiquinone/menaquinone biosynthesis C-methylase UbiE
VPDHRWNSSGSAYSTREWLDNHHAIKSRLRTELVGKLPINPGDYVVDLGCATGNWTMLLADRVGIRGNVVGIDINADSLAIAEQRRQTHVLRKIIRFSQTRLEETDFQPASVDVFVLFNILSYLPSPWALVQKLKMALRPGGRIFLKDTDLQSDFFWPVPFEIYSTAMSFVVNSPCRALEGNYNPFFARSLPGLLRSISGIKVTTLSQSFSFFAPLSIEECEYVRANAALISAIAEQNGGIEAAKAWFSLFDEENENSVLANPDFMYSMNEFIFQGVLT